MNLKKALKIITSPNSTTKRESEALDWLVRNKHLDVAFDENGQRLIKMEQLAVLLGVPEQLAAGSVQQFFNETGHSPYTGAVHRLN